MEKKFITSKKIMEALKQHSDVLRKYRVKRIGLFGSYATGKHNKKSDIDFLVEFQEPTFDNFMDLAFYLEQLFGKKVDLLTPEGVKSIRIREISDEIRRSVIYA